jgi:predicted PurR-regulated permease PerM
MSAKVPEEQAAGLDQINADEETQAVDDVQVQSEATADGTPKGSPIAAPTFVLALLGIASIFVIIFGIQASAYILSPIILAGVITIALMPVPGKLKRRGVPGWAAVLLTILAVFAVLGLVILFVLFSMGQLAAEIPTYAEDIQARQQELAAATGWEGLGSNLTEDQIDQIATAVIGIIVSITAQLVITLFIFAFMLSAAVSMPSASRMGLDPNSGAIQRVSQLTEDVRRYLSTMTVINLLVGLGDTIFLWILGVDFALLWGILAWFLGYIPSIGFWLAMIPPIIMAWAEFGPTTAFIVFLGYVLINGSVQNIVQPRMMGDRLHISPAVVFISLFVWGWLLGGIGAILAVPLTLVVLAMLDSFDTTRWLVILVRFKPDDHTEDERREAQSRASGLWGRFKKDSKMREDTVEATS